MLVTGTTVAEFQANGTLQALFAGVLGPLAGVPASWVDTVASVPAGTATTRRRLLQASGRAPVPGSEPVLLTARVYTNSPSDVVELVTAAYSSGALASGLGTIPLLLVTGSLAFPASSGGGGSSTGAIVGGVVGGVCGLLLLAGGGYYIYRKRKAAGGAIPAAVTGEKRGAMFTGNAAFEDESKDLEAHGKRAERTTYDGEDPGRRPIDFANPMFGGDALADAPGGGGNPLYDSNTSQLSAPSAGGGAGGARYAASGVAGSVAGAVAAESAREFPAANPLFAGGAGLLDTSDSVQDANPLYDTNTSQLSAPGDTTYEGAPRPPLSSVPGSVAAAVAAESAREFPAANPLFSGGGAGLLDTSESLDAGGGQGANPLFQGQHRDDLLASGDKLGGHYGEDLAPAAPVRPAAGEVATGAGASPRSNPLFGGAGGERADKDEEPSGQNPLFSLFTRGGKDKK